MNQSPETVTEGPRRIRGRVITARSFELPAVYIACVIVLIRFPHRGQFWHNLWAEDGFQFLRCRVNQGVTCIGKSYQGYQQLIPRIVTQFVAYFPVTYWAIIMALVAVALDALCLTLVYRASAWLLPPAWIRAALVLIIGGSAAAHWEVAGNLANLHWFLLLSAIFVAANRDANDSVRYVVLRSVWLVATCLSEGLAPVIAVAYLVGLVLRRYRRGSWDRADIIGGLFTVAAGLAQFINSLAWPREHVPRPPQTLGDVAHDFRKWVLDWGWAGPTGKGHDFARVFEAGVAVLMVAGVVLLLLRRDWRSLRWEPIVGGVLLGIGSILCLGLSVLENDSMVPRYVFVPFAFVVIGIVVLLYRLFERFRPAGLVAAALTGAVLVAVLALGPYPPRVSTEGPSWRVQIANAAHSCKTESPGARHVIVIAPKNFAISLTCARIKS